MINVENIKECTGCSACTNICPMSCIEMGYDEKGFFYPQIDTSKCIECGKCENVCHYQKPLSDEKKIAQYYVAYNKCSEELENASSGGIFWCIVKKVLEKDGVVYGAGSDNGIEVKHIRAESIEECDKMRKSKYQQSELGLSYKLAKKDLEDGREVLFSGTPCQVAALKTYVGKEYTNLTTVEVICHGIPSKKILGLYLDKIENEYNANVKNYIWRDKRDGWEPNKVVIQLNDNREIVQSSRENLYQKGFLQNLYLRPSCYNCRYARLPRVADITLGDFWGYDGALQNGNKGLSLVAVTSTKGKEVFDSIRFDLVYDELDENYCKSRCRHLWKGPKENKHRKEIYEKLENISLEEIESFFSKNTWKQTLINIRKKIKKVLKKNG